MGQRFDQGLLLLCLVLLSAFVGPSVGINYVVKFSSDAHLEHDTQASTGQTTGVWLVYLYNSKEKCPGCDNIGRLLDKVAAAETSSVLFSKVDCFMSPDVSKRFGVTEFPHIMLFKDRKMYVYAGTSPVTMESILDFAENGGGAGDALPVPDPLGWKEYLEEFISVFTGLVNESPSAAYAYGAGFAALALGLISTIVAKIFPRGKISAKED